MTASTRVGALDIAQAIHGRIGSYVDMNFMQFLAVEGDRIHCWYMNSGGEGPTFHIELVRNGSGWNVELTEHPAGTEQEIEVPKVCFPPVADICLKCDEARKAGD